MSERIVIIPIGYIWLQEAWEQLAKFLMNSDPQHQSPNYRIYIDEASDIFRTALISKEISAFYCCDDGITQVSVGFWRKSEANKSVRTGELPVDNAESEWIFIRREEFNLFFEKYQSGLWPFDPNLDSTKSEETQQYMTPFMIMMMEAIKEFSIPINSPKKDELISFFLSKSLPDGTPISNIQASHMATFCRPPEAMKGGNKRVGK